MLRCNQNPGRISPDRTIGKRRDFLNEFCCGDLLHSYTLGLIDGLGIKYRIAWD